MYISIGFGDPFGNNYRIVTAVVTYNVKRGFSNRLCYLSLLYQQDPCPRFVMNHFQQFRLGLITRIKSLRLFCFL